MSTELQICNVDLCVVKLGHGEKVPDSIWHSSFLSITRTDEELSIICEEQFRPPAIKVEAGFGLIKILGPLDFNLTGILNTLLEPMKKAGIPVFVISTYDTDYILLKKDRIPEAIKVINKIEGVRII